MKFITGIIVGVFVVIISFCGLAQQVYFNNIYNLCANYDPEAWSVADGIIEQQDGYVLCGATVDTIDYWMRRIPLMKIGLDGEMIWKKDFGDSACDYYTGRPGSFKYSCDRNKYFISGTKNLWNPQNYAIGYLMVFDTNFDTIYTRTYNLNLDQIPDTNANFEQMDVCENSDLVFGGSMNGSHLLLWRTDSSGNTRWYKTFHYGTNTLCTGYSVIQTSDGGFALGGYQQTITHPPTGDPIIVKTDSLGNQEWVKFLGGPYLDNEAMLSLAPDGNIIMGTAYAETMTGNIPKSRIYIVKLDNSGNIIWDNKYGASLYSNFLLNIRSLKDGSIIASGGCTEVSIYYGWILKVDTNGDSVWYRRERYFEGENSLHYLYDIIPTSDNGFLTCGNADPISPDNGIRSAWVMKLDSLGCDTAGCDPTVGIEEEHGGLEAWRLGGLEIWPNPAHNRVTIMLPDILPKGDMELRVYDVFGREMLTRRQGDRETGRLGENLINRTFSLDVSGYSPGMYIAVVKDQKNRRYTGKFVIAK